MIDEIAEEVERLKLKKIDLVNRMNFVDSYRGKEEYKKQLETLENQIRLLEQKVKRPNKASSQESI